MIGLESLLFLLVVVIALGLLLQLARHGRERPEEEPRRTPFDPPPPR